MRSGKHLVVDCIRINYNRLDRRTRLERYSHIETLDRDILHALIERIEIGEKILPEGLTIAGPRTPYRQSIRIFYRFIGEIAENSVRDVTRVANL